MSQESYFCLISRGADGMTVEVSAKTRFKLQDMFTTKSKLS